MSKARKVQATKVRQHGVATKSTKPGKPYRGGNTVAQKIESSKKSAKKAAAGRRAAK